MKIAGIDVSVKKSYRDFHHILVINYRFIFLHATFNDHFAEILWCFLNSWMSSFVAFTKNFLPQMISKEHCCCKKRDISKGFSILIDTTTSILWKLFSI